MKPFLFPLIFLFLSGCFPLSGKDLEQLAVALAKDTATACVQAGGGGGGGAMPVMPIPVPAGGGGYGYLLACRSNQPGSIIEIKPDGTVTVKHGVYKTPPDEKEAKETKERLEAYEKAPKIILIPKPSDSEKESEEEKKKKEAF